MVLHLLIAFLLVFAMSGMTFHSESMNVKSDVIIVVDVSDSNFEPHIPRPPGQQSREDTINSFVKTVIDESGGNYNIGVVTFGTQPRLAARPSRDTNRVYNDFISAPKPPSGASDIAAALIYASEQLSNPSDGRIILISDGLETDGSAMAAARAIARTGTRVDTVFLPSVTANGEVAIVGINVPARANVNSTVTINVSVRSRSPGTAMISIYDNGVMFVNSPIILSGGVEQFSFDYVPPSIQLHEIRAEISAGGDAIEQNNVYYSFIDTSVETRILIVEGVAGEATLMRGLLASSYTVDVVSVSNVPNTLVGMQSYDEIILMNVRNSDMPAGFAELLHTYVHDFGGGLFTTGGDRAYQVEDMSGTLFEEILPVDSVSELIDSIGLLIMIDTSSSMYRDGRQRLDWAKQGAITAVNSLSDADWVGVISFAGDPVTISPMTPATQKQSVIDAINSIPGRQNTNYQFALEHADSMLTTFNSTDLKHIIMITDGDVQQGSGHLDLARSLAAKGVTFSVVTAGIDGPAAQEALQQMANLGGGRLHLIQEFQLAQLPGSMVLEIEEARDGVVSATSFRPHIRSYTPVVQGVTQLPELGGAYPVRAKQSASVILSRGPTGYPVYTEWTFGAGRVGSFSSDLSGFWSAAYFTDAQGSRFISNVVGGLLPDVPMRSQDLAITFEKRNLTTQIQIRTQRAQGDTLSAMLYAPGNSAGERIALTLQSDMVFAGTFETNAVGLYRVTVVKRSGTGELISEITTYTAFSYSAEYAGFDVDNASLTLMSGIADIDDNVHGQLFFLGLGTAMFGSGAESIPRVFDPRVLFLILSAILFLLDVAVRNFKFKWPWEIVRERKAKKASI